MSCPFIAGSISEEIDYDYPYKWIATALDRRGRQKVFYLEVSAEDEVDISLQYDIYQHLHYHKRYKWLPVVYLPSKRILCMPYLGKSLSEKYIYLNQPGFDVKFSKTLFSCIAEIHLAGLCHADIDPAHVVCDLSGRPRRIALIGFKQCLFEGMAYPPEMRFSAAFKARDAKHGVPCTFLHDWESALYVLGFALDHYLPWITYRDEDIINRAKTNWLDTYHFEDLGDHVQQIVLCVQSGATIHHLLESLLVPRRACNVSEKECRCMAGDKQFSI
jgi:hypothetical protein